ncbi:methionine gamma-lyase [Thermoflavimicrobium daqui]|uniref:L-methionine gamma-lyase n=2 Tax=Thermoflavimicrobium daqui TaxID=2137476 RepID=A0A364K190_9BACL|nr:methionine gamma-lyase [Thermoflavimicrobium daqui]RAL21446.1 methionine gamma-lyase [Thermoflavimicrobium daqui]
MNGSKKEMHLSTKVIHAGNSIDPLGALATPIYQTSTFVFSSVDQGASRFAGEEAGYIYSRLGNPTIDVLEQKVATLEKAEAGLAFASGMAAVSAVILGLVKTGDHILCSKGLYGCTYGFFNWLKERFGVNFSFCEMTDEKTVMQALQDKTKVIYIETPINPTMELVDLAMIAKIAKQAGIKTIVDNTFMSPYLQRPLEWGCDIVIHSATKYIGGHGDVVAGLAVGSKELIDEIRLTTQKDIGGILAPLAAYLLIRGIKTLSVRMERHCENAQKVAEFLESHPKIAAVYYPGLASYSQNPLAKRQMDGFGGMISFCLKGGFEAGIRMMNHVTLCKRAVSLGDVESLIQHPASMTHAVIPREKRIQMGISDGLIRLSVGLEDVGDIIEDLEHALLYV